MYDLKVEITSLADVPTVLAGPYLRGESDDKISHKIENLILDSRIAVAKVYFLLEDSKLLKFVEGSSIVWNEKENKVEEKYIPLDNSFPIPTVDGDEHGFYVSLEARAETDIDSHTFMKGLKSYLERQLLYPANLDTRVKRFFKKKGISYIVDRMLGIKRRWPSRVRVFISYQNVGSTVSEDYNCLDNIIITVFGEYNSNL